jgi:hypothetical protein
MPFGLPGRPMTRQSSCRVVFACGLNDDSHVAQIDCILGVPVEIWASSNAGCGKPVDHRTVSQNRKVEGRTVESDELWR